MSIKSPSARILREEYDAFLALIKNDPNFPETYDGWVKFMNEEDAKRTRGGLYIQPIEVHAQEFANYRAACGLDPSLDELLAFVVKKANREA